MFTRSHCGEKQGDDLIFKVEVWFKVSLGLDLTYEDKLSVSVQLQTLC